ncbi:MAG: low affinity iron permease family protein [Brevundimonas sp.]|uniref:low affinity iron permease family protein n=1 Tax=Brevundimonas sp. TaxID=1871086 RepID=UPI00248738D3|nr:low affinity iron permease family protein [Brevundimonas sp.]MDI1326101.1 low affinity iron permease family protein [Brevundimonas sp.]
MEKLLVFLIQNTQNRDGAAMQAKLDELIHVRAADERFIGVEHMTEKDLQKILLEVEGRATRIHGGGAKAMPVVATRAEDSSALVQQAAPEARKTRTGARPRDKASV